jgi:NADPH:quinone reductase-like Zn-dependent oxidoreductase
MLSGRRRSIQFGHAPNWIALLRWDRRLMRAAVLHDGQAGRSFVLTDWPDPIPGPGEVLVRVDAVCVNRTDVHVIERTHIGGLDPAGVVVALGPGVSDPPVGTRVVARPLIPCLDCRFCHDGPESACERPTYIGVHRPGGFAELVALPARAVHAIPSGVEAADAAAAAHSVPIAIHLLETVGRVTPRDTVLIVGAAGGVGIAALQVARHLGARVIAVASDDAKLGSLERLGADVTISSADPTTLAEAVRAQTGGRGVSVAVDNVGSPELWPAVVASMDKGGRILSCGAHAGGMVALDMNLFYRMQLRLLSTAGTTDDEFRRALGLVADGVVSPIIHAIRPLDEITAAFADLLARRNTGKIVLRVAP